jgi:hypothetical protein
MTAQEIIGIANQFDCKPHDSAVAFARMLAEHCAQLAHEAQSQDGDGATAIRSAFRLEAPT